MRQQPIALQLYMPAVRSSRRQRWARSFRLPAGVATSFPGDPSRQHDPASNTRSRFIRVFSSSSVFIRLACFATPIGQPKRPTPTPSKSGCLLFRKVAALHPQVLSSARATFQTGLSPGTVNKSILGEGRKPSLLPSWPPLRFRCSSNLARSPIISAG